MATVTGPASSTDNAVTRWDGTSGSVVQDSTVLIDDTGNITEVNSIGVGSNGSGGAGCYIDTSGNVGSYGYISAVGDLSTNADMTAQGTVSGARLMTSNGLIDTDESTGAIIATQLVAANSGSNIAFVAGGGMSGTYVVTTTATNAATTLNLSGNADISGTNTGDQTITLTGDVTGSGTGSFATTIKSSVALAGSPTTTTQSQGDDSTKIATTAYVDTAVAAANGKAPTFQYLTSGSSATYTTPAGCTALHIEMWGGGGGGNGTTTGGGAGGDTIFNSVHAKGGGGGTTGVTGSPGGSGGSGTATYRQAGGGGSNGGTGLPGNGAVSSRGGAGIFGHVAAIANTGSGGCGATSSGIVEGGGGAGEQAILDISSPASTYTYTIGAGGTAGTGGSPAAGVGGSGFIVVTEYY